MACLPLVLGVSQAAFASNDGFRTNSAQGLGWRIADDPTLTIGEGASDIEFYQITDVVQFRGSMFVGNGGSQQVFVFDSIGRHINTIGGDGEGPGEFRRLSGIVPVHPDSLFLFDALLARITVITVAGQVVRTFPVEPTGDPVHPLRLYQLGGVAGDTALIFTARAFPANMNPRPVQVWDSVATLAYTRSGALLDTVAEFSGVDLYSTPETTGGLFFGRATSSTVHNSRLYMTDGGRFRVRVYDIGSSSVRTLERDLTPRVVAPGDMSSLMQARLDGVTDEDRRRRIRLRFEQWPAARYRPRISSVVVDTLENCWVQHYQHDGEPGPAEWTVFDARGAHQGHVVLPRGLRVEQIGRDYVLGVWTDQYDVESIRTYRLTRN